jgi:CII-binding regulator of phage lambda lysogenization HflD
MKKENPMPELDTEAAMKESEKVAFNEFLNVMRERRPASQMTRHAISILGIISRLKSQQNAKNSLSYRIVKDISKSKEELREYVKNTQPDINIKRLEE